MARLISLLLLLLLCGCQPLALSLLGAGAGTALRYGFEGVAHRTFTAPAIEVKEASIAALERMGLAVDSFGSFEGGELIYARAENRAIEIEVEPISPRATRIRIAAKNGGLFYDGATASEIVSQTEKLLASRVATNVTPAAADRPAVAADRPAVAAERPSAAAGGSAF